MKIICIFTHQVNIGQSYLMFVFVYDSDVHQLMLNIYINDVIMDQQNHLV